MITRDSISDVWGPRTPYFGEWPERVDERTLEEPERWVQSACVLCSNGCALDVGVKAGRIVGVRGRAVDRVNRGRLGPKGLHGWIANHAGDRLTQPLIRRDGRLRPASFDEAMDLIVRRSRELKERHTAAALGFYTSGQLMLEEYYTQAIVARAGIGTNHLDGNTRLCTSTAAMALIESFGTDGDPGSYGDYDVTDAVSLFGHNMAETQTVLWSRLLDRRAGPRPPRLLVVDPRRTPTAREADLHLQPRAGTNLALINGILHCLVRDDRVDHEWVRGHTVGFDRLAATVAKYGPALVEDVTGVPSARLEEAAELVGTAPTLVSSCLQGVYQSMQATATAVQVNNVHLLRGLIGKPGCTVFQMNGQPTAQNTRECGANGELAVFLNWANPEHVAQLGRHWNVDPERFPHYGPPTHVMQMFRYAEEGSLRFLWITATNPAVSLPDAERIRRILTLDTLFVVVQDAFLTETARLADVVLPAALWAEKTGTFTNADRTVHLSQRAIEPPGEARSDFDIVVDYARRMGFTDRDGAPLVKWRTPEEAFEHWKELTRGRPCDYSGLTYQKLAAGSGIQWPCNERYPEGRERLYEDGVFPTRADECETYGHDLTTGAAVTGDEYRAHDPGGRAMLKPADWQPPPEQPDRDYPLWLTTGRQVWHFHTRTKTGRAPELRAAAGPYLEIAREDAAELGIADGDLVVVESRRARVRVPARITELLPGHVFLPFHYGWWDTAPAGEATIGGAATGGATTGGATTGGDATGGDATGRDGERQRAANELTLTSWDAVSKQPHFKFAAVRVSRASGGSRT